MVIFISGFSGVGKNTVISKLIELLPDFKFFVSCTTRERRQDDGKNRYIYLTKSEFTSKIKNGEIFEHEEIHGEYYGTLKSDFNNILNGQNYIKDIGVEGCINYEKKIPKKHILTIFLYAKKEVLLDRLIKRGDDLDKIKKRLERYEYEDSFKDKYDYVITNDVVEDTVNRIIEIVNEKKLSS